MNWLYGLDWQKIFVPQASLLEIFIRGTIVYLVLFMMLRVVLKRQTGNLGMEDLLVLVLIADAAQNSMADSYHSVVDGLLLVTTILFWSRVLNWVGYHFPRINKKLYPESLLLVKDGQMIHDNMKQEFMTERELKSWIRTQGIEDLSRVKCAYLEGDGQISVITKEREQHAVADSQSGV